MWRDSSVIPGGQQGGSTLNVSEVQICDFYHYFINQCDLHMNFRRTSRTGLIFSDHLTLGLGRLQMLRAAQTCQKFADGPGDTTWDKPVVLFNIYHEG